MAGRNVTRVHHVQRNIFLLFKLISPLENKYVPINF